MWSSFSYKTYKNFQFLLWFPYGLMPAFDTQIQSREFDTILLLEVKTQVVAAGMHLAKKGLRHFVIWH